jgi:anion-transporting  ArsA/GET3 family ATPase
MALAAARGGRRALVVEVAGQHRLSRLFRTVGVADDRETELAPGLFGISIDAERATEEYLSGQLKIRPLVEVLTRSRAFHTFAAAAPGLPELVTVGKIWSLAIALGDDGAPVWDTVVVDCPATGHGIALLETAGNVADLAANGPIREQAARIQEVVSHPAATGIVIVALPEELAVAEALEASATLRGHGLPVAATVLNGVHPLRFADDEAPALEAVAQGDPDRRVRAAARAALRHLAHQRSDAAYRDRLAREAGVPVIDLPRMVRRRMDVAALETLADALSASPPATAATA